ncbi:MAG: sigma-54-dependent Fis family transcriptional regulator [candidate division Zixibacteria bacterium]|nr:sigma-54-dependent Fis family transcriptional regulator [candidate division Zixibacteria bacterium]
MMNSMLSGVILYGRNLFSSNWDKICSEKPEMVSEVSSQVEPIIPKNNWNKGTVYVDVENNDFIKPEFLNQLIQSFDRLRIIGVSDSISENKTIEIAKMGVAEILTKDEYNSRVSGFLDAPDPQKKPEKTSNKSSDSRYDVDALIGISPKMVKIKNMITQLSDVDYPNAIFFGETGTGKDLLAKVMHHTGVRKDSNFVEVNCSAIPDELFESELFGHIKGAFTDAKSDKIGLFEFADNGTIFLDEIGNLSLSAQAKLLKILESRTLRPLGAVADKDINVRVLAATNVNLEEAVEANQFRRDLLFRLNLIAIHLPSLHERKEDIEELAKNNFDFYRTIYNKPSLSISNEAISKLNDYNWPGNVRELRNVMERIVLLASTDKIKPKQISEAISNGRISIKDRRQIIIDVPRQGIALKSIEKQVVGEILNFVEWNRTEAAKLLGISRARLRRIMDNNKLNKNKRKSRSTGTK